MCQRMAHAFPPVATRAIDKSSSHKKSPPVKLKGFKSLKSKSLYLDLYVHPAG